MNLQRVMHRHRVAPLLGHPRNFENSSLDSRIFSGFSCGLFKVGQADVNCLLHIQTISNFSMNHPQIVERTFGSFSVSNSLLLHEKSRRSRKHIYIGLLYNKLIFEINSATPLRYDYSWQPASVMMLRNPPNS